LLAVLAGTSTLIRPFVGVFLSGFSRRALLGIAACTVVIGVGGTPFLSSPLPVGVLLGIFGIGFGLTQPLSMVMVADLVRPEHSGVAMGLRFTVLTAADLLGPVLLGFVVEGLGVAFAFCATAAVVAAVATQVLVVDPGLVPGRREERVELS
jgi:MFS family permease